MPPPVVERTLKEIQLHHKSEAEVAGMQASFTESSIPGDLSVWIIPRPTGNLQGQKTSRHYLYRRDPISGKFTLIKKT